MPMTEARARANKKWDAANIETLGISVPKGMKAMYREAAAEQGLSLNAWARQAMEEKLDKQVSE